MICLQNPQLKEEDTNTTRNTKKRRQSDVNQSCDLEMLLTLPNVAFCVPALKQQTRGGILFWCVPVTYSCNIHESQI